MIDLKLQQGSVCEGVLKAIRSIIRAVDLHSKMLDQSCGMTGPQLLILKELDNEILTTTSELANKVMISQSTATIIIDRLVEKGVVERIRDTIDKRKWFISLTNKGKEVLKNAPSLLHTSFIEQFEKLADWEQSQTLAALQRVVAMFQVPAVDDSSPIITGGKDLV